MRSSNVEVRSPNVKSIRRFAFPDRPHLPGHFELLAMNCPSRYSQCLKALSAAFCIASAILAAGCADPLEKPIGQEAGEKFKRGITGGGTLVPIDPANTPDIKPPEPDSPQPNP
jgi:hypothetical protein